MLLDLHPPPGSRSCLFATFCSISSRVHAMPVLSQGLLHFSSSLSREVGFSFKESKKFRKKLGKQLSFIIFPTDYSNKLFCLQSSIIHRVTHVLNICCCSIFQLRITVQMKLYFLTNSSATPFFCVSSRKALWSGAFQFISLLYWQWIPLTKFFLQLSRPHWKES